MRRCSKDLQKGEWIYYKREDEKWKGPAKIIGIDGKKLVVSQGGLISRVAAGMSARVGEEFIPISEEGSGKEQPEMKVDNPHLRTNIFQEEWCAGRNSKGQGVTSIEGNELSSEVDHNGDDIVEGESVGHVSQQENLSARKVKEKVGLRKDDKVAFIESDAD